MPMPIRRNPWVFLIAWKRSVCTESPWFYSRACPAHYQLSYAHPGTIRSWQKDEFFSHDTLPLTIGLLDLANSYCEQQLKKRCVRIIKQGISHDTLPLIIGLLDLANSYCEQQLKKRCERIIKQGISVDNVAMLYATAIKYQVKPLTFFCIFSNFLKTFADCSVGLGCRLGFQIQECRRTRPDWICMRVVSLDRP